MVLVPVDAEGLELVAMPPTSFTPEIPHFSVRLHDVRVPATSILEVRGKRARTGSSAAAEGDLGGFEGPRVTVVAIHQPWVFWGTLAGIVVIVYGSAKLASHPVVREMCDALLDLQEGTSDRLERVPAMRRRWVRWRVAAAVVLAGLAVLGVLAASMMAP